MAPRRDHPLRGLAVALSVTTILASCAEQPEPSAPTEPSLEAAGRGHEAVRFATFNASLNRAAEGQLVADLSTPDNAQARTVAEIIQRNHPDVLLINEFDFVAGGEAARLFQKNYLSVSQNGASPVVYPYRFVPRPTPAYHRGSTSTTTGRSAAAPTRSGSASSRGSSGWWCTRSIPSTSLQGGANATHLSDPRFDTADFADGAPGNLRADYVLPSRGLEILRGAVYWPVNTDPLFALVGVFPFPSSDHRLVWIDVKVPGGS